MIRYYCTCCYCVLCVFILTYINVRVHTRTQATQLHMHAGCTYVVRTYIVEYNNKKSTYARINMRDKNDVVLLCCCYYSMLYSAISTIDAYLYTAIYNCLSIAIAS